MNRFVHFVTHRPKLILSLVLLATLGLGSGLLRLDTRNNQDSELPADDPIVETNDRLKDVFGDKAVVLLAIETDDVFRLETLAKIAALSDTLATVEGIIPDEILSLTTVNTISGRDWGLEAGPFIETLPETEAELQQLREDVRSNPLIYGQLVSQDETLTLISAHVEEGYEQETIHAQVYAVVEAFQGPERIHVAGDAIQPQEVDMGIQRDVSLLLPLVLVLILIGFYFSFRTLRGVLLPFSVAALSIVWTMGLMGLIGYPITVISSALPILMVAVASSYGIHVVHRYYEAVPGHDGRTGTEMAVRSIGPAVLMTGLTSALGSATLIIFRVTSIREFGVITALGILSTLVLTLTVIPATLALLKAQSPKTKRQGADWLDAGLVRLGTVAVQHRREVLIGSVVVLLISAFGISRIQVGNDFVKYFPRDHRLRVTFETLNEKLGGARYIDVMIEGAAEDAIKDPELLRQMEAFQEYAESFETVGRTHSFVDILRRINLVMHENDPAYDRIPDDQATVAQYLLLYSMSGDPGDFGDLVDYDFRRAKIRVMLTTSDQNDHTELYQAFQTFVDTRFSPETRADFGGDVMFWLAQVRYIVIGKLQNIVLALAVVLIFCMLVFRSFSAGLLSVVPLTVSTMLTFGVMGFVGIRLETGTAIITAIAVGIGVDFALHFLARFRQEFARTSDVETATSVTMVTAGKAIAFDVLSNVLGFVVFIFSGFLPIRYFGWLVSLTMITTGLATYLLMPALIATFQSRRATSPVTLPDMKTALSGLTVLLFALALSGMPAHAQDLTARQIVERTDRQQRAGTEQVTFEMVLENKKGKQRKRRVVRTMKTDSDDLQKVLIRFEAPADVRGTGLLAIENEDRADDQWLYLPALRRSRRISPNDQTDSFMGTDFAYEDIGTEETERFDYTLLRTETLDGVECYVIEAVPSTEEKREESGYSRRELWIDAETFVARQTLFYNKQGEQIKRFTASDIRQIPGTEKWRAHDMQMENLKTGHQTILHFEGYVIDDAAVNDDLFTERYLERGL